MTIVLYSCMVLHFCYLFSYPSFLELHYGGRLRKSQTTREQDREAGLLIREAECRIDTELFLNEYPQWEWGHPINLSSCTRCSCMPPSEGRKAHPPRPPGQHVETQPGGRPICPGTCGVPDLSQGDLGHLPQCFSVEKVPRSPPCGSQWRREAICNILSSLKSQLHWRVYLTTAGEA